MNPTSSTQRTGGQPDDTGSRSPRTSTSHTSTNGPSTGWRPTLRRPSSRTTAGLAAAVLAAVTLLPACSDDQRAGPPPTGPDDTEIRDIGVDPQDYIDDYVSPVDDEDLAMAAPTTMVGSGAADGGPIIDPYDDNTFVDPGHTGPVATVDDAVATFGLDVDTGSYAVGRQWIDAGTRPEQDSVRTEEWVNALTYGYDTPERGLGLQIDGAPTAFGDGHLVRVAVQGAETEGERRPANVVMVVDTSGSMDIADRLGAAQASLALLAQHLPDGDTISIVTYADEAEVVLEPTPVEQTDTIVDAIDALEPSGSTNMEAGLTEAYDLAEASFRPDGINRVILASDGVANQGVTDPVALAEQIQDRADDGIQLVTVGYGMGNLNDHTMEQLADRGDGFYAYIDTYEEAEQLFATEVNSTIEPVALDARAQITFDPDAVSTWRQIGYENRALDDEAFTDEDTDAGEIGAGHDVTALFEVDLSDPALDPSTVVATASLRWQDPLTGETLAADVPLTVGQLTDSWEASDVGFRAAAAAAAGAELLAGAPEIGARGVTLVQVADELDSLAAAADAPLAEEATELADLLRRAADLPAPQGPVEPGQ